MPFEQLMNGDAINTTIGGLSARTRYVFQMRAFTIAGDGDSTRTKTVETLGEGT